MQCPQVAIGYTLVSLCSKWAFEIDPLSMPYHTWSRESSFLAMNLNLEVKITRSRIDYIRAERCWRSNNLKSCLDICEKLMRDLTELSQNVIEESKIALRQLRQLIWFLRLKCLSEDYFVNVSFLLDEDDIDSHDNKVRVFDAASNNTARTKSSLYSSSMANEVRTRGISRDSRSILYGTLTGRQSSVWSGRSTRVKSSYRPLTTGLTASQTAFSRSTRPLLKYSCCDFLSKLIYDYLYNAQAVTSQCPDYRQCLEYIKLVEKQKIGASKTVGQAEFSSSVIPIKEADSKEFFWMMSNGICNFNLHIDKEAEKYFRWALAKKPLHVDGYTWLIKTNIRTNELVKVLQTCELGIKNTKNSILFNWKARILSLNGDLYTANLCLRDSLKFDAMNIEALANVGYFSFYNNNLEQSLKCFQRIQQLSLNHPEGNNRSASESSELLNNLAICNLYCGFYHRPIPLFNQAFLSSQSNETTSDIWYNLSFVQLSLGLRELAIGCLRLALKNNAQNYEALNNLGVLLHGKLINDRLSYENVQEYKGNIAHQFSGGQEVELENLNDLRELEVAFDEAESYFKAPVDHESDDASEYLPEALFNMAVCKWRRGQMMESVKYCKLYMVHDPSSYHIQSILRDIQSVVAHDS